MKQCIYQKCAQEYVHSNYHKCAGTGNIALGQPANQSEKEPKPATQISSASSAVDGRRESCTKVEATQLLWWSVDLGDLYNIAHVTITSEKLGIIRVIVRIGSFHVQFRKFQ